MMESLSLSTWSTSTLLYVILFACASALVYWWYCNLSLLRNCNKFPGLNSAIAAYVLGLRQVSGLEIPGVAVLQFTHGLCKAFEKDGVVLIWLGLRPVVLFYKPETVEVLVNNSFAINKSAEYRYLEPWLGKGLLTSTGERWKAHRKLLTPTFHFRILEDFLSIFNEQSEILVEKIEASTENPWTDITSLVTRCTLDIICESAMGVRINVQSGGYKEYVNAVHELGRSFMYRVIRPWIWQDFIFYNFFPSGRQYCRHLRHIQGFTKEVIKSKKEFLFAKRASSVSEDVQIRRRKPFLELLLEQHLADPSFTEEDVREEVDTFMFEGHDTTAMGISWTLYTLGLYQDIQEKVFQELCDIFQGCFEAPVTPDALKNMKYLECVIKETLRLYSPVPYIGREVQQSIKVLDYTLEPGVSCFILPIALHHDAEQFPIPEKFDPDRFLPENSLGRHPYAYIPFSAGPRNCIGQRFAMMELKTVLAHIIRKFKFVSLDQRDVVHTHPELILRSAKPLRLRFCRRDK